MPESSQSSYDMAYHSSLRSLSSMMHFGAQELSRPSASLDFESQVESGLDLLDFQSILRMSLAQPTPLNYTRVSSSSIEVNHELQAVTRPQHSSVHSVRAKNMEIIRASLGRSFIKLDDGLERCSSYDVYAHVGEASHPISRDLSGYLHDMLIQRAPKLNLEYLRGIFELKPVPSSSYEFSTTTSVPWTCRIESSSCSMVLHSGSNLNIEDMWQALVYEGSNDSWVVMSAPAPDTSSEHVSWSFSTSIEAVPSIKNLVSSFNFGNAKALVFIRIPTSSQGEHIDHIPRIVLAITLFRNSARRACSLFIYLVVWAPKDYIADTA